MPDARPRRLTPRVAAMLGSAGVLAVALSGCAGAPAPTPTPTVSASAAPIFASDEEALAAAIEAYEAYSRVLNKIANENSGAADRIREVATASYSSDVEDLFADLTKRGLRIDGLTTVDSFKLVESAQVGGRAEVLLLVCSDVSGTRVINAEGRDVTPAERPARSALQVKFVTAAQGRALLVDEEDPWLGEYC